LRSGELYVFADAGTYIQSKPHDYAIKRSAHYGMPSPILHMISTQLLAYHTALENL
jgi:glutamine---fructose-6-phosphate transaminase (isomerizing)